MTELRRAMTHHDLGRHAEADERLALEGIGIDASIGRGCQVQLHVDERCRKIFHCREALIEGFGALDLGDRFVEEVMQHRSNIEMIDASLPILDILAQVLESPHSRLPLYKDEPENIVGVLHAKDLLRAMHKMLADGRIEPKELARFKVLDVAMKPYFIPETTTLDDQMRAFLERKSHFALVVDEYGALQGLITLEDILEEIVGEIADEFDAEAQDQVEVTADGAYIVDGTMTLRDLNRMHDWSLPDDEANTIAGLVIHEAQMIPVVGQVFSFHGFRFEVLAKEENRISSLKIRPL